MRVLGLRYTRSSSLSDLIELTRYIQIFLDRVIADDDPERPHMLLRLTILLQRRFRHTGNMEYLDNSITTCRRALDSYPENSADRAMFLDAFSTGLQMRFEQTGRMEDINEAITSSQVARNGTLRKRSEWAQYS